MTIPRFLGQGGRNIIWEYGQESVHVLFLGLWVQKSSRSSISMANPEEYLECVVGLVPTVILSGHSLNLVHPFSRNGEN